MQINRFYSVGRWMAVAVVVAACGCTEGEWERFRMNQSASKNKPATKARRPVNSEPAVAETKNQPAPAADDPNSREVDEKVERYVQSMEPKYDPSYQNNDFSSKIQRQSDPDRAARVRQTAIRSRTEPEGNESENVPVEAAIVEPSDDSQHPAQSDSGADNGDETEGGRQEVPADQDPATPAQGKAEMAESNPPPNSEDSTAQEESATADSAMTPPVLSQVTIEPSSTPADAEAQEDKSARPAAENRVEEKQVVAATSNEDTLALTATEEVPSGAGDESSDSEAGGSDDTEAPPVPSKTIDSPSPQPAKQRPAVVADHNATEAASNKSVRVDTPVEKSQVEVPEPKQDQTPPATVMTASEKPIAPAQTATNSPATAPPATGDALKKKVQAQEAVAAQNPDNVEEQFKLRMLYLVDGQDKKALAPSPGLDAETQEIMLGQLRAVQAAGMPNSPDPAIWANRQLEALEKLRGLLRSKADVLVPKVELCRAIDGFGRYEPFDPLEFKAGAKNRVLLYIEVDNFKSEKTASGMFRTLLSVRESLMNKNGEELWSAKDDNIEDLARGKRRDFYLTIGPLAIPKSLAPGEYVFKVEVEDVLGGKINSNVVRFKMVP